jgi:hypothetical protein
VGSGTEWSMLCWMVSEGDDDARAFPAYPPAQGIAFSFLKRAHSIVIILCIRRSGILDTITPFLGFLVRNSE